MKKIFNWNFRNSFIVALVPALILLGYALIVNNPAPVVETECLQQIEAPRTKDGQLLLSHPDIMKVFEDRGNLIAWVDEDQDGTCDKAMLFNFVGVSHTTGENIYVSTPGTCEQADQLMVDILNDRAKEEAKQAI